MTPALQPPHELLVADLFAGLGGFTEGARQALEALGLRMRLVVVNHWQLAVDTHRLNHPDAVHHCTDAYKLDPRAAVPGGRLDLLLASPTCTYFSKARGGRPISWDQRWGRMTPTQVYRWLVALDVTAFVVENVEEFEQWGRCHRGPVMEADGKTERTPAPPVRDELCLVAGCDPGKPCVRRRGGYFRRWWRKIEALGYRLESRVLCAADFGDATTRERLFVIGRKDAAAIVWPEASHSPTGSPDLFGGGTLRWRGAREAIDFELVGASIFDHEPPYSPKTLGRVLTGAEKYGWHPLLVEMIRHYIATGEDPRPLPLFRDRVQAVLAELARERPEPFVLSRHSGGAARGVEEPAPTQVAKHSLLLAEPMLAIYNGQSGTSSVGAPLPTVTTRDRFALVSPALVLPQNGSNAARSVDDPAPVVTTTSRGIGLVVPVTHAGARRARSLEEPAPTVTGANRGELALAQPTGPAPFMVVLRNHADGRSLDLPAPAICAGGTHLALAQAFVLRTNMHKSNAECVRSVDLPAATITTDGGLSVAQRKGQAPRVRSVEEPAPTVCAKGRLPLVEASTDEGTLDVRMRMLQPRELGGVMSFPPGYRLAGTKTEQVRMIGNAVPVRTAAALVGAIFAGRAAAGAVA